jgi:hypothetical protein
MEGQSCAHSYKARDEKAAIKDMKTIRRSASIRMNRLERASFLQSGV